MARVIVIGAGPMGLAAAYKAACLGHRVRLVEADSRVGGMAAHFDFDGLSIERFYHFVCRTDYATFELMDELGIGDRMRWVDTSMAYFLNNQIYKWGDPFSLLRFPHLTLAQKIRTGAHMLMTSRCRDFDHIESLTARQWIERGSGSEVYEKLWKRLNELKFFEYADEVSASWMAARIRRISQSTRGLFQQQLGYIDGGSQTLVETLADKIRARGGEINLGMPAQKVTVRDGRVTGLEAGGEHLAADAVISTVPTPLVNRLVPDMPANWKEKYDAIKNIAVVCVVHKLKRSVTPHFWVNIVDPAMEIPGIIEFSNLRRLDHTVVYVPYYMPVSHHKWSWSDQQFIDESFAYIQRINPALGADDLLCSRVARLRYSQPVCEPNFHEKIPPLQTPIAGLMVADTCYYYPMDRGVCESVRLGQEMAINLGSGWEGM